MTKQIFMNADEVAKVLDVSKPYAYRLIHKLNQELEKTGFITLQGRIDRRYFQERFYATHDNFNNKEEE